MDRYCLVGGGYLRVGFLGDRSVIALSSNRSQRLSRIKVGSTTKTVRKRLRGERAYKAGSFTWYVAKASRARIVIQTRRGKVVQMGLADKQADVNAEEDRRAAARLLDAASGAPRRRSRSGQGCPIRGGLEPERLGDQLVASAGAPPGRG